MNGALGGTPGQCRDVPSSVYVGNLDDRVTEELIWELFLQAGPLNNITMPTDSQTGKHRGYAFVEFQHSVSGPYAIQLLDYTPIFNQNIRVRNPTRQTPQSASTPGFQPTPTAPLNLASTPPVPDPARAALGFAQYPGQWYAATPTGHGGGYHNVMMHRSEPHHFQHSMHDSAYGAKQPLMGGDSRSSERFHRSSSYGWQDSYHSHSVGSSPDFRHSPYQHGSNYGHRWGR